MNGSKSATIPSLAAYFVLTAECAIADEPTPVKGKEFYPPVKYPKIKLAIEAIRYPFFVMIK